MFFNYRKMALVALMAIAPVKSTFAKTEQPVTHSAFGKLYQTAPTAAPDQAQVVLFRSGPSAIKISGANVYIDGHFHTSLLPGGYTLFCIPPGEHSIGAYQNDAPLYQGKLERLGNMTLEAGKTYFLSVSDNGNGIPSPVQRPEAEQRLRTFREQTHAISRAATPACKGNEQSSPF